MLWVQLLVSVQAVHKCRKIDVRLSKYALQRLGRKGTVSRNRYVLIASDETDVRARLSHLLKTQPLQGFDDSRV
jgi:hypothetical protein